MAKKYLRAVSLWANAHYRHFMVSLCVFIAFVPAGYGVARIVQEARTRPTVHVVVKVMAAPEAKQVVTVDEQTKAAYHEAAHALAIAYLIGPQYLGSLDVWTKVPDGGLVGAVTWASSPPMHTQRQFLFVATEKLAGRAADKVVNGAPTAESSLDLTHVTNLLIRMRIAYGLGGLLIVKSDADAADYAAIEKYAESANRCAEALVTANADTVKALGDLAMTTPLVGDVRAVSGDSLREFFRSHPISGPMSKRAGFSLSDDPCAFPSDLDVLPDP